VLDKAGIGRLGVRALRPPFATRAIENGLDCRTHCGQKDLRPPANPKLRNINQEQSKNPPFLVGSD